MIKSRILLSARHVVLLLIFASLVLTACTGESNPPQPPILTSIKLDQPGVIANFQFKVDQHHVYYFYLRYRFPEGDRIERARVRKILGGEEVDKFGNALEPGVPTPIKLVVSKVDRDAESQVYQKQIDPVLTSWEVDAFSKLIGFCDFPPGVYRAHVEALRPAPDLASIPTQFVIAFRHGTKFDPKKVDRSKSCPQ